MPKVATTPASALQKKYQRLARQLRWSALENAKIVVVDTYKKLMEIAKAEAEAEGEEEYDLEQGHYEEWLFVVGEELRELVDGDEWEKVTQHLECDDSEKQLEELARQLVIFFETKQDLVREQNGGA